MIVAEVSERLRQQVPSRVVFEWSVPDGPAPDAYLVVTATPGSEESTRAAGVTTVQTPSVWVRSIALDDNPDRAARKAGWGAFAARRALRDWKPFGAWSIRPDISQAPLEQHGLPRAAFVAVEQFSVRTHIGEIE